MEDKKNNIHNTDKDRPSREGVIRKNKKEEFPGEKDHTFRQKWESDDIDDEEENTDQKGFDRSVR